MAVTRKFLIDLGIEKDQIQSILDEHGATVELLKDKAKEDSETLAGKLNEKIASLQDQLDNVPTSDDNEWKAKYEAEVTAHKATVDGHITEKTNATTDEKVMAHLVETAKMHKSAAKNALKQYDRSIVEFDKDGNIKNADMVTEHFRTDWADFFGTEQSIGAGVATPPKGGAPNERDMIRQTAEKAMGIITPQ